jgi:hypothetical protein
LDELNLVSSESSQVGDIEDAIVSLGVLTVDTSDLDVIFVGNGLMESFVLHQLWKVDVDGGSETGSKVSWAVGDVTEMLVVGEFSFGLNLVGGISESLENLLDVGTLLHGNNSELILLVDPDKESLGVVVEDTSSLWPVSLETAGFKIFITTLEKEMISDELVLLSWGHLWERVIFTLKISVEFSKSGGNKGFDLESLLSGNGGSEWVGSEVSSNSNSSGVDHFVLVSGEWWAVKLVVVHGGDVLIVLSMSVILSDNLVEKWGEGIVRVVGSSVDTNTRVGPFSSGEDSLFERETIFVSSVFASFPDIWGKAFLEERRSSRWEVWHTLDIIPVLEVRSHEGSGASSFGWLSSGNA